MRAWARAAFDANRVIISDVDGNLIALAEGDEDQLVGFDADGRPTLVDAPSGGLDAAQVDDRIKPYARRHGTQSLIRTNDITPREITHELLAEPCVREENIADNAIRNEAIPDDEISVSKITPPTSGPSLLRWDHAEAPQFIPQFGTQIVSGNLVPTGALTWLQVSGTFSVTTLIEEIVLDLGWPTSTRAGRSASAHQHHIRVDRLLAARAQRGSNHPTDGGAVAVNQCPLILRDFVIPGTTVTTVEARDAYLAMSNVNSRLLIAFRETTKYAYDARIWWR